MAGNKGGSSYDAVSFLMDLDALNARNIIPLGWIPLLQKY